MDLQQSRESWVAGLRARVAAARAAAPLIPLEGVHEEQIGISAECFTKFLRDRTAILSQRTLLLSALGYADPLWILTGDMPLLSGIRGCFKGDEVLQGRSIRLVAMLDSEYEAQFRESPEPMEFQWHVRWWSRFSPAGPLAPELARTLNVPEGGEYSIHAVGLLWGPQHGFKTRSLWRIHGDRFDLVAPDFEHQRFQGG